MTGPQISTLPDGKRVHFHHGPTDVIVEIFGPNREEALSKASERFQTMLAGLVGELNELRAPYAETTRFQDPTARRMQAAVGKFAEQFITPMAAVAGAIADEIIAALTDGVQIEKAYANNGGDIAIHLGPGQKIIVMSATGPIEIPHDSPVRGVATSGWRGRSHSLGIADAVTVVAGSAAVADAAATMIANAVDLPGNPAIHRIAAKEVSPDTDLGTREITADVGPLSQNEVDEALSNGVRHAEGFLEQRKIHGASLTLNGQTRIVSNSKEIFAHA